MSDPAEMQTAPRAWMRRWAFDGIEPQKERNSNGRLAWPAKFRFHAVTVAKVFDDDVPLYDKETAA